MFSGAASHTNCILIKNFIKLRKQQMLYEFKKTENPKP